MVFTTTYKLDKPYFYECFDQSLPYSKRAQPKYFLLALLVVLGLFGIYGLGDHYLGTFLLMLALLECIAFYYRRPWWVTRQMLSKASNSEVTLTIDEQGVLSESFYHQGKILWQDITTINETNLGFVLHFKAGKSNGKSYLSKSCLSSDAQQYIRAQNNS